MKTIGIIGGMSWQSTMSYYKHINEAVGRTLGGSHSAKIIINSVEFHEIEQLQMQDKWDEAGEILAEAAKKLVLAGADFILIGANTMHRVYDQVKQSIELPVIHLADSTAEAVLKLGIEKVGLLGTAYTMEKDFYKKRLSEKFGISVIVPNKEDRKAIHDVIFDELIFGIIKASSKEKYLNVIERLYKNGAQAVILGCTEIALLIKPDDCKVTLFDTAAIHADAAVKLALSK